jgi:L-asparaginase
MNEEIHSAREVRKTYTSNVATFNSPGYGPIGLVDEDRVIFLRKSLIRQKFSIDHLETSVELIKATEGGSTLFLNAAIDHNVKGIVIEGFGRGDVPPNFVPAIRRALRKGIVVVMTSRCFLGRVLGVYGYSGGGRGLKEMGVIFAGDLSGPKARMKLMVVLASVYDIHKLTSIFELEDISWG